MNIKGFLITGVLITIVGSSLLSFLALNNTKQNLSSDFEIGVEESLLEKTITQAKQLGSILGKTASIVEASANLAEKILSDPSIPVVPSFYHDYGVTGIPPPDLHYNETYGREISLTHSAFKIAPTGFITDYQDEYCVENFVETKNPLDNVNSTIENEILLSAKLDPLWRVLYSSFPGQVWLYMGFESGFHRSFPWHSYSCSYDPRIRPWYVGAVTGAKDVVLIFDTSGSMAGAPLENTKKAAKLVTRTLGPRDRVNVLTFSGSVQKFRDNLEIYSDVLQEEIDDFIDSQTPIGSTNINESVSTGLDMLIRSLTEDRSPIIIFMTDGEPTAGETNKLVILNNIREKNSFGAKIFVFGLGEGIDKEFLTNMGEQNSGAAVFIENNEDISNAMTRYYQFFTSETQSNLIWSYPYIDISGFGFIITVSKPVIVNDKFYGVISADLTLKGLIEEISAFKPSINGYNFIFDSAGIMVVHPSLLDKEPADWEKQDIRFPIEDLETEDPDFIKLKIEAMAGKSVVDSVFYGTERRIVSFSSIGNTSLRFASIFPHSDITGDIVPNIFQIEIWQISWVIFSGIGIILGVVVVLRSTKTIQGDK
ncbi:MAG: VWA domain-containing protein [Candidatus Hodarchaeales archaeon]